MTLLGGRYETLKAIASGGMATVHLGRAVGVGGFERLVAIKVMHPHIAGEPDFVTMFLDEARLAARIRHPNVVPTLDVQRTDDGLFLVMELIDGPSLREVRRRLKKAADAGADWLQGCRSGGRLPLSIAIRIMVDVLAGLEAAHVLTDDQGEPLNLIHRDVTPANILVGADGQTRLTDFGVARAEARLSSTRGGQLKGKVPYMPPEQLMSEGLDQRGDIYAAGVVLWEELVGRRLFKADNEGALLQRIFSDEVDSPRQLDAEIPEALDAVVMKAITRDPAQRYPTAAAFGEALESAARASGITIASARTVAAFLVDKAIHRPLDLKELGALKAGTGPQAVGLSASSASIASSPSGPLTAALPPGYGSSPSGPQPMLSSSPSGSAPRSGITATEAALSTRPPAPPSSRWALLGGAAIAVVGLAGGFIVATRGDDTPQATPSAGSSAVGAAGDTSSSDTPPAAAPATSTSASPAASTSASAAASATGTATPAASAASSPKAIAPRTPINPSPNKPPPPRPKPGTFNPDRL